MALSSLAHRRKWVSTACSVDVVLTEVGPDPDLLENEIASIKELYEVEPDSKCVFSFHSCLQLMGHCRVHERFGLVSDTRDETVWFIRCYKERGKRSACQAG